MKTLIAIPCTESMHAKCVRSLLGLTRKLQAEGENFETCICEGTLAHLAREKLACKAINEGFDEVLWIDADMVYEPDVLEDLRFCGHDFVTGLCYARRSPHNSCAFYNTDAENIVRVENPPEGPCEIDGCGFACVLIKTEILKAVKTRCGSCFCPEPMYGEDLAFCRRARALGYKIWLDPHVQPGHLGLTVIYRAEAETYQQGLEAARNA